jgi:transposase
VTLFCGIDWAETHHDVAIIDGAGQLVAKKRIPDNPTGFAELIELLSAAGDCAEAPGPVAIETPRGLLVASLRATGPVYAINPLAVARYRERHSVARAKSDHADAMALANILRVDAHLHRRLPADSELCQAIAVLARAHQDAIWRRTAAHHQLRSLLREFYPDVLGHIQRPVRTRDRQSGGPRRVGPRAHPGRGGQTVGEPDLGGVTSRRPQPRHRSDRGRYQSRIAETATAPTSSDRQSFDQAKAFPAPLRDAA